MTDEIGYFSEDRVYCYPGSSVLINQFKLQDPKELEELEQKVVSLRLAELNKSTFLLVLSAEFLKQIHHYLFQDLYLWAGKIRSVRLNKERIMFAYPENIDQELEKQFLFLRNNDYFQRKTKSEFSSLIADFKTELNCIHPFRDGNGRSIRKLIEDISFKAGYQLLFKNVSFEEYQQAMIESPTNNHALKELIYNNLS